jgi:hypothetical protein
MRGTIFEKVLGLTADGVWTSQPHRALGNATYASLLKRIPDIQQLPPDRDIGATIHELEADQIGLKYMARAGYGPHEAIAFWKRMVETKNGQQPPELPSTHPAFDSYQPTRESYARRAGGVSESDRRQ